MSSAFQLSNLIVQGFGVLRQFTTPSRKFVTKRLQIELHAVEKLKRHAGRQKFGYLCCPQLDFVRQLRETSFNGRDCIGARSEHFTRQSPAPESILPYAMPEIGSRPGWSCAMATILCASGFQLGLYAQQAAKLSPKVMAALNAPPVELKEDDPPLLRQKNSWKKALKYSRITGRALRQALG
jgi:hypothetical protein